MPTFQEQANQNRFQSAALAAQMNDPRLRQLVDTVARQVTGKGINQLSTDQQKMVMQLAMAAQNSFGQMIGLENGGDQFSSIFQGVIGSGAMPVTGGFASGRSSYGSSYGPGNNAVAVAAGIHNELLRNIQNKNGGMNYGITNGLSAGTVSQIAAQQIKTRTWNRGDVVGIDFGHDAAGFAKGMAAAERSGVDVNSKEYKDLKEVYAAVQKREQLEKENPGLSRDEINARLDKDTDLSASAKEMAKRQARGSMHGTYVTKQVTNELLEGIRTASENVKALGDIFGTQDFEALQANAKALGMGSLTDKRNIASIKQRIERANVQATMSGRSVQEVLQEQADIMGGLSGLYGGQAFVPAHEAERLQKLRTNALRANELGMTTATADELVSQAARSTANATQMFGGMNTMDYAVKLQGGKLTESQQKMVDDFNRRFEEAHASGDRDGARRIAREAEVWTQRNLRSDAQSEEFRRAANANSTRDLSQLSIESASASNLDKLTRRRAAQSMKEQGSNLSLWREETGDDMKGTKFRDLASNILDGFGGDMVARGKFFDEVKQMRGMSVTDRQARMQQLSKEMKEQGLSDNTIKARMDAANTMVGLSDQGFSGIKNEINAIMENPTIRQLANPATRVEENRVAIQQRQEAALANGRIAENGTLSALIGGLLGDGGMNANTAVQIDLLEKKKKGMSLESAIGDNGFVLGETDDQGRLTNREALMKNQKFLEAMGADTEEKKARLAKQLETNEGTMAVFRKMEQKGMGITNVDKQWVAANAEFSETKRKEWADIADKYGISGLTGVFDNISATKDKLGITVNGKEFDNAQAAVEEVMKSGTFEQKQAVKEAAAAGNKTAIEGTKKHNASLMTDMGVIADHVIDNDEDDAGSIGVTGKEQLWQEKIEPLRQKGDAASVQKLQSQIFGNQPLAGYENETLAKNAGMMERDGKKWVFKQGGIFAGKTVDEVQDLLKKPEVRESFERLKEEQGAFQSQEAGGNPSFDQMRTALNLLAEIASK